MSLRSGRSSRRGRDPPTETQVYRELARTGVPNIGMPDHVIQHVWLIVKAAALQVRRSAEAQLHPDQRLDPASYVIEALTYPETGPSGMNVTRQEIVRHPLFSDPESPETIIGYLEKHRPRHRPDVYNFFMYVKQLIYTVMGEDVQLRWLKTMNTIVKDYVQAPVGKYDDLLADLEMDQMDDMLVDSDDDEDHQADEIFMSDDDERGDEGADYMPLPRMVEPDEEEDELDPTDRYDEPRIDDVAHDMTHVPMIMRVRRLLVANLRYLFAEAPDISYTSRIYRVSGTLNNINEHGKGGMFSNLVDMLTWIQTAFGLDSAVTYETRPAGRSETDANVIDGGNFVAVGEFHQPTGEIRRPGIIVGHKKEWTKQYSFVVEFDYQAYARGESIQSLEFKQVRVRSSDIQSFIDPRAFGLEIGVLISMYPRNPLMGTALFNAIFSPTVLATMILEATQVDRAIVLAPYPLIGFGMPPGVNIRGKPDGRVFTMYISSAHVDMLDPANSINGYRSWMMVFKTIMYAHMFPPSALTLPTVDNIGTRSGEKHKLLRLPILGTSPVNACSSIVDSFSSGSLGSWFGRADDDTDVNGQHIPRTKRSVLFVRKSQKDKASQPVPEPMFGEEGRYNVVITRRSASVRESPKQKRNVQIDRATGEVIQMFQTYDEEGRIVQRRKAATDVYEKDVFTVRVMPTRGMPEDPTWIQPPKYYDQGDRYDVFTGETNYYPWEVFETHTNIYVEKFARAEALHREPDDEEGVFTLPLNVQYIDSEFPELSVIIEGVPVRYATMNEPNNPFIGVLNLTLVGGMRRVMYTSPETGVSKVIGTLDYDQLTFGKITKIPSENPSIPSSMIIMTVGGSVGRYPQMGQKDVSGKLQRLPNPEVWKHYTEMPGAVVISAVMPLKAYPGPNISAYISARRYDPAYAAEIDAMVRGIPSTGIDEYLDNWLIEQQRRIPRMRPYEAWWSYGYANVSREDPDYRRRHLSPSYNPVQLQPWLTSMVPGITLVTLQARRLGLDTEKNPPEAMMTFSEKGLLYSMRGTRLEALFHFHIMGNTYPGPYGITGTARLDDRTDRGGSQLRTPGSLADKCYTNMRQFLTEQNYQKSEMYEGDSDVMDPRIGFVVFDDHGIPTTVCDFGGDEGFTVVGERQSFDVPAAGTTVGVSYGYLLPRVSGSASTGYDEVEFIHIFEETPEVFLRNELGFIIGVDPRYISQMMGRHSQRSQAYHKAEREHAEHMSRMTDRIERITELNRFEYELERFKKMTSPRIVYYAHRSEVLGTRVLKVTDTLNKYADESLMAMVSMLTNRRCTSIAKVLQVPRIVPQYYEDSRYRDRRLLMYFRRLGFEFSDEPFQQSTGGSREIFGDRSMRSFVATRGAIQLQHPRNATPLPITHTYGSLLVDPASVPIQRSSLQQALIEYRWRTFNRVISRMAGVRLTYNKGMDGGPSIVNKDSILQLEDHPMFPPLAPTVEELRDPDLHQQYVNETFTRDFTQGARLQDTKALPPEERAIPFIPELMVLYSDETLKGRGALVS